MGQTVTAGPGGQVDLSKVDPLLAQLSQATSQKVSMTAAPKPVVAPADHSIESSCLGPTLTIGNPLPGPLGTLNLGQMFTLGTADLTVGASPPQGGGDQSSLDSGSGTPVAPGGGTVDNSTPGAPGAPSVDNSGGAGAGASPAAGAGSGGLGSGGSTGSYAAGAPTTPGAPSAPSTGGQQAQGSSAGGGSPSSPIQSIPASSTHAQGWLTFLLTMLSGLVILGTAFGIGGTISRMARAWRQSVSPLG
jgi:hypothetical protein